MSEGASVIRTPGQRLRVFISSTLREFEPERRVARSVIEPRALSWVAPGEEASGLVDVATVGKEAIGSLRGSN